MLENTNPTSDWERVGDRFYRKTKIYEGVFDPDLELENYLVAAAPFAGAIGRRTPRNQTEPCSQAIYRSPA